MEAFPSINYLQTTRRWRLGWLIISVSSFALMILALFDPIYESLAHVDFAIDLIFFLSFFSLFLIGIYLAYRNGRILKQIEHGYLPAIIYPNIKEKGYCPNCGHHLGTGAKYCEYCGTIGFLGTRNKDIEIYSPDDLSKEDIEACISLIKKGGAVSPISALVELPRALVVTIKRDGQEIVGVGAIKRKRPRYYSEIAKKSGVRLNRSYHELGFIVIDEPYQDFGMSDAIVEKLLATFYERPLFATTSNEYMKNTLEKAGFVWRGKEWQGMNGMLSLWIKEAEPRNERT